MFGNCFSWAFQYERANPSEHIKLNSKGKEPGPFDWGKRTIWLTGMSKGLTLQEGKNFTAAEGMCFFIPLTAIATQSGIQWCAPRNCESTSGYSRHAALLPQTWATFAIQPSTKKFMTQLLQLAVYIFLTRPQFSSIGHYHYAHLIFTTEICMLSSLLSSKVTAFYSFAKHCGWIFQHGQTSHQL